jgi:hypothetical protein
VLRSEILADPLYREAFKVNAGRSILGENCRLNLFLIMKYFFTELPFGHIVEFGTYKGGNALFMAYVAKRLYPGTHVYALDTFEGMPPTDANIDKHKHGNFKNTTYDDCCRAAEIAGLDNLFFVKGLFVDTLPKVVAEAKNFRLAHIDCDIYEAVRDSYLGIKPALVEGAYTVFDDPMSPDCLGASEAVEEILEHQERLFAEQISPHFVFRKFPPTAEGKLPFVTAR